MHKKEADAAVFVPHIEAGNAIKEIDEIISIDGLRVIKEGVSAEDRVVINGLMRVRPSQKVTPEDQETPPQAAAPQAKTN